MEHIKVLNSIEEFNIALDEFNDKPFYLLKHSTRCPISSTAYNEYQKFAEKNPAIPCFMVLVVENREVSNYIANTFSIKHESPQAFLIFRKSVLWNDSHGKISSQNLSSALLSKELS